MRPTNKEIWAGGKRITLTVEAVNPLIDSSSNTKHGLVVFSSFVTDVADSEGNPLGSIGGGTGHVMLHHTESGKTYLIRHDDLWQAFVEALA